MIPSFSSLLPESSPAPSLPALPDAAHAAQPQVPFFMPDAAPVPVAVQPDSASAVPDDMQLLQPESDPAQLLALLLAPVPTAATPAAATAPDVPPPAITTGTAPLRPNDAQARAPLPATTPGVMVSTQPLPADAQRINPVVTQPAAAPGKIVKLRTAQDARAASQQLLTLMQAQPEAVLTKTQPMPVDAIGSPQQTMAPLQASSTVKTPAPLALPDVPQAKAAALREALGERLQMQIEQRSQKATIRLDPPQLGKLDISLHYEGGKLQVQIQAAQPEVYRALQQVSHELRGALSEQNNVAVNVQISQQQGEQRHAPRQQHTSDAVLSNTPFEEVADQQRHHDLSILTRV